jgi:signal peptidase I
MEAITVPEGELFCMGDNRRVSLDSRDAAVGCVDQDEILGKVFVRLYPFSEFSTF